MIHDFRDKTDDAIKNLIDRYDDDIISYFSKSAQHSDPIIEALIRRIEKLESIVQKLVISLVGK
jgi:hypothetical protein